MNRILLLAPLLLAACAQQPQEPLSDEQRAMVLQMLMNRPAAQPIQIQPYQMPPPPRTTNCRSVWISGQLQTTCY